MQNGVKMTQIVYFPAVECLQTSSLTIKVNSYIKIVSDEIETFSSKTTLFKIETFE